MPGSGIPDAVRRLIAESIDSVPELEAILLLREGRGVSWTPEQAGRRLYVSTTAATHILSVLTERGLFVGDGESYRYAPARPELEDAVDQLAVAYAGQLVAVTQLIHAKPSASVREFADAFRIRRDR